MTGGKKNENFKFSLTYDQRSNEGNLEGWEYIIPKIIAAKGRNIKLI